MMATGSPVCRARAAPRLAIRVVFPLFPLGLKKATTWECRDAEVFWRFFRVSSSSSPEKGFTIKPPAPDRSSRDWASASHRRLMPMITVWG